MINHSQTLERLAERGGLSATEMLAVVLDMGFDELFQEAEYPTRTPAQRHNQITRTIMSHLLQPVREGGKEEELLLILEGVFLGTHLALVKLGRDKAVFDFMIDRMKQRLAEHSSWAYPDCRQSMTVYVDDMYKHPMGRFGRMKMSHMIADTEEELHAMADKIGLARKWYQGDHYDVSMSLRAKAIAAGAKAVTWRELGEVTIRRRRASAAGSQP